MEQILQQAPPGITQEYIETIWEKHKGDVVNILAELWNVEETPKAFRNISVQDMNTKKKFDEIRDICDAFDTEMNKQLDVIRMKSITRLAQQQPKQQLSDIPEVPDINHNCIITE